MSEYQDMIDKGLAEMPNATITLDQLKSLLIKGAHGVRMRSGLGHWQWRLFGPAIKGSRFVPTKIAKKLEAGGLLVVDRDSAGRWTFKAAEQEQSDAK